MDKSPSNVQSAKIVVKLRNPLGEVKGFVLV